MSLTKDTFDYIVVGGGISGSTLASTLHKTNPALSILLIEAGPDVSKHPLTQTPLACFAAHFSDLDWNYTTTAQPHLDDRTTYHAAGKALGGGSAINYGTWTRGSKFDFDRWGTLVGDDRWSYEGFLPYFDQIEKKKRTSSSHGEGDGEGDDQGTITTVSVGASSKKRQYPLRERMLKAWEELGDTRIADANSGYPLGIAEMVENWKDGKRQIASQAFDLSGVTVLTDTMVQKILLEERAGETGHPTAIGVELVDGRRLLAAHEVILSAGAYRTPQLLMLSGIGPAKDLESWHIPVHVDLPSVGQNFHDHLVTALCYRLKDASTGFAMGGAAGPWADPAYQLGLPCDWIVTEQVPKSEIEGALQRDTTRSGDAFGTPGEDTEASLMDDEACHLEMLFIYAPAGAPLVNTHVPFDGTHIGALVSNFAPTSRGSVTISSTLATDSPVIDPNYNASEVDRTLMRYGVRRVLDLVHNSLADVVDGETPPPLPSLRALTHESSDQDIDARVRSQARTFFHGAGTASMGSVVDTELKVKGVRGLRVVDASVIPLPIVGHYQVVTYALGVRAAEIIAKAN